MFRRFSANFAVFSMYLDFLLIWLSLFLAVHLRPFFNYFSFVKDIPGEADFQWFLYFLFPVMWVGILLVASVYDGRKNLRAIDEFSSLTLGSLLAMISMAGVLYLSYRETSRFLFLTFVILASLLIFLWRSIYRYLYRKSIIGRMQNRRVIILGYGRVGRNLADQIREKTHFGLNLVGFLDDDHPRDAAHLEVLGGFELSREIITELKIDDVVIALPRSADSLVNRLVSELHDLPVRVWIIPDYFSLTLHRASVEEFAGIPMLDLRAPALSEYQRITKRGFDLIVSVFLLPFLSPVMVVIGILIKLDSPGPIIYLSSRVGENGRLFKMYKFRSMVANADQLQAKVQKYDDQGQIIHKIPQDPRVTKIGRFLRKTSLDELPQIINVLKNEMSLVGPRPEMPFLVEKYVPWQRKRFAIPQGITGWWQVNGRSDKPMHLHTEDDLYYVQHYSIWLDLQILVMTLGTVLRGKGAF
jgi:exopolysaccharide biosynthesis polyprenyl glycosylphosphotransferase